LIDYLPITYQPNIRKGFNARLFGAKQEKFSEIEKSNNKKGVLL
jgi:hypothetical protein